MNGMKSIRSTPSMLLSTVLTALFACVLAACDSDGNDPIDPRLAFEGRFVLEEFQFRFRHSRTDGDSTEVTIDSTVTVTTNPRLFFESVEGGSRSMMLDPIEFMEVTHFVMWDVFAGGDVVGIEPEFLRLPIVVVGGSAFEVENTRFRTRVTTRNGEQLTLSWEEFAGNGALQGNVLDFEFSMLLDLSDQKFQTEGSASGLKRDL